MEVNLPFLLYFTLHLRAIFQVQGGGGGGRGGLGASIWRGDLTEGLLRYRFGGLIFRGAYTWKGLISEFPVNISDLIDSNVDLLNGLGLVHEKFDAGELGPTSFGALDSCHSL